MSNHSGRMVAGLFMIGPVVPISTLAHGATEPPGSWQLQDKTMVAWVTPANTTQRGGSVLTIENLPGQFDGLVFGELEPGRWMAGSDFYRRTARSQASWPEESAGSGELIQVAVSYRGKDVSLYRNGQPYAHYRMEDEPVRFSNRSIVLIGLRHWEILGGPTFLGEVEDARIYAQALDGATLAGLRPNQPGGPQPAGLVDLRGRDSHRPDERVPTGTPDRPGIDRQGPPALARRLPARGPGNRSAPNPHRGGLAHLSHLGPAGRGSLPPL